MRVLCVISAVWLAGTILAAEAQTPPAPGGIAARLSAERVGPVEPGLYSAGDDGSFVLEPYERDKYLLRFSGTPENFVLTVDRASLGARILKYDTGTTALRVSVWGGLTLYTKDNPGGVPVTRQGDAPPLGPTSVSEPELETAIGDETGHIAYIQNIDLKFSADPAVMSADPETRGRAFDSLVNVALAIERFISASPAARQTLSHRINSVKIAEGGKPTVTLSGQTLLVSFVPGEGHEGRASSLAIEQELDKLLAMPARDVATK
jgi:hypothetical protein